MVAELKHGAYFVINLGPGQYMLFVDQGIPLSIDTRSGQPSFIRLDWNYAIGRSPIPVLAKVREQEARREIRFLDYVSSRRVHSNLVPKTDPGPPQPQLRKPNGR